MNEEVIYYFLKIISDNGSIGRLIRKGLNYKQIAELSNEAIENGLVIYSDDSIMLSEKGALELVALEVKFKKINKEEWIEPDYENKILDSNKNIIFIPSLNELNF